MEQKQLAKSDGTNSSPMDTKQVRNRYFKTMMEEALSSSEVLYKLQWHMHSPSSDGSSTPKVAMEEYLITPDIMEEVLDHL